MKRYLIKLTQGQSNTSSSRTPIPSQEKTSSDDSIDLNALESDPGLRKKISEYHPNLQDDVRRAYLLKGPCQPRNHNFPLKLMGGKMRRFVPTWFDQYANWLEYSTAKDAAFCLCCYLFKTDHGKQSGGDSFVCEGFSSWNKKDRLDVHIGGPNSSHNVAVKKCEDLMRQKQSTSLKTAIEHILGRYGLNLSSVRGHGYDGASNMRGEFNGLKALIMRDNKSAYYIHCFAHQLQLTLVAVAKNHSDVSWFFSTATQITNVISVSCKRRDTLREKQAIHIVEALSHSDIQSGRGLNQEICLKRACDTRWGSHYGNLINLTILFTSVVDVHDDIYQDGTLEQKGDARGLLCALRTFDFALLLHLMTKVLGITNELSITLQRRDQDIVNAMSLVTLSKQRLQHMRDEGWNDLFKEVCSFCNNEDIDIPIMNEQYVFSGRSRRKAPLITNMHHYQIDLFYHILDMQLQELNNRFNETNTELLLCVTSLNPCDSFSAFDKEKVVKLAGFYPNEFPTLVDIVALHNQLENYIFDVTSDDRFSNLQGIGDLARKLVETKKHVVYPMVYLLVKLALLLPVATASVERVFSAMTYVKNKLRNRMCSDFMNDCLVTFIEKDLFENVSNESIVEVFQNMKTRRVQL